MRHGGRPRGDNPTDATLLQTFPLKIDVGGLHHGVHERVPWCNEQFGADAMTWTADDSELVGWKIWTYDPKMRWCSWSRAYWFKHDADAILFKQ